MSDVVFIQSSQNECPQHSLEQSEEQSEQIAAPQSLPFATAVLPHSWLSVVLEQRPKVLNSRPQPRLNHRSQQKQIVSTRRIEAGSINPTPPIPISVKIHKKVVKIQIIEGRIRQK